MFAWIATRTGVQLPSPPAFARNGVESEGCRAVALAKADHSGIAICFVASYGSARPAEECAASPTFTFCKANAIQGVFTQAAQTICASDWFATMRAESRIQQSGSRGRSRPTSPFPMLNAPLSLNAILSPLPAARSSRSDFKFSLAAHKKGRLSRRRLGEGGHSADSMSQLALASPQDVPRLEANTSGGQGIFASTHSKLAIRAA